MRWTWNSIPPKYIGKWLENLSEYTCVYTVALERGTLRASFSRELGDSHQLRLFLKMRIQGNPQGEGFSGSQLGGNLPDYVRQDRVRAI
jgi:hypothetical protein